MTILNVKHTTTYNYAKPVSFGDHRLMCRPRDSHDLRLLETGLTLSPPAASTRWVHDVFGNSIAIVNFGEASANQLMFQSTFRAEHYPVAEPQIVLEEYAQKLPFSYAVEEVPDLGRRAERHYPDPEHAVDLWARAFLENTSLGTMELLQSMTHAIKDEFSYARREEEGTQSPTDTLKSKSGSCRDFALLMMEGVRSLGLAAEFVSGYLYDEKLIGAQGGLVGGGETHAWCQVYLPGAGWVEFDPTNALVGGRNLIRVAVARDASQAVPIAGSFIGEPGSFIGLSVNVEVTAE